jgi:cell division septum initiation protein DivIVA
VTTSRGGDGGKPAATSFGGRSAGARYPRPGHDGRPLDGPSLDAAAGTLERPRFGTVVRGYERDEVDRYVGQAHRLMARLRSELTDAEERRRRADQRIDALEVENRAVRARLESAATPPEEGFGVRAEKLLRLAEQEAAEVRSEAVEESAILRQQVREDIERQRHEAEQTLIARSAQFDEHAARRTAELQQREQQLAEQLTAARDEAEAVQSAARRAADHYRQRVEADVEQVKTRVNAEVAQIREQATQELDRIATLESGVRAELRRLSARLTHEIGRRVPDARHAEARDGEARDGETRDRDNSGAASAAEGRDADAQRAESGDEGRSGSAAAPAAGAEAQR